MKVTGLILASPQHHHCTSICVHKTTYEAPCALNLQGSASPMWVLFGHAMMLSIWWWWHHDDVLGMVVVMASHNIIMVEVWGCEAQRKKKRQTETQFCCTLHIEIIFPFFAPPLKKWKYNPLYSIQRNHIFIIYFFTPPPENNIIVFLLFFFCTLFRKHRQLDSIIYCTTKSCFHENSVFGKKKKIT